MLGKVVCVMVGVVFEILLGVDMLVVIGDDVFLVGVMVLCVGYFEFDEDGVCVVIQVEVCLYVIGFDDCVLVLILGGGLVMLFVFVLGMMLVDK